MVTLALLLFVAQNPSISGERSIVSKCEVSDDPEYGYTKDKPIRVGGTPVFGASRQRRYLQALVGPAGQPIAFKRRASLGENRDKVIIDLYDVTYPGIEKPIELYLDFYRWDPPKAPRGFLCGTEIGLSAPTASDGRWEYLIDLGIKKGLSGEEIPPIPLSADGSTRYGIAIDPLRYVAGAARMMAAAGATVTRQLVRGVRFGQFLAVAYPIACDGQMRRPVQVDVSDSNQRPLTPSGNLLGDAELRQLLPWMTLPSGATGKMFSGPGLPAGGQVHLTYDGPACPSESPTVALAVKAGPPTKVHDAPPVWPLSVARVPGIGPIKVIVRATIDLEGVPTNLEVTSGPSEFNQSALEAVRQWRYKPFTINGAPAFAPVIMTVTVTFSTSAR